jgi:hypothetical protein
MGILINGGKPLGKLRGPFGTNGDNRNGYDAHDRAWKNAANDPLAREKFAKGGGMGGRIDHTNERPDQNANDETLVKEIGILVKEFPKRQADGSYVGEALIMDNEPGQQLYALCKAGFRPGISYRGGINAEKAKEGDTEGAWNEFTVEGFDIVYVPAYEEARLDLVEDYLENTIAAGKKSKRAANIDSKKLAGSIMRVCASADTRKKMLAAIERSGAITAKDIEDTNSELEALDPSYKKDISDKAKRITKQYEPNPKHIAPLQEGNVTMFAHDVETKEIEDVLTGRPIDVLDKGTVVIDVFTGEEVPLSPVRSIKELVENVHEGKKPGEGVITKEEANDPKRKNVRAEATLEDVEDSLRDVVKQTAKNALDEEIDKVGAKVNSGLEMGMAADKEVDDDKEREGFLEKEVILPDGTGACVVTAGTLGVAADELEVEKVTEYGDGTIEELETETVEDGSETIDEEATLQAEVGRLVDTITTLENTVAELTEQLSNRDTEFEEVEAKYKRLKASMAAQVDTRQAIEARNASLKEEADTLTRVLAQTKKVNAKFAQQVRGKSQDAESETEKLKSQIKKLTAQLATMKDGYESKLKVQASAVKQAQQDKVMIANKNDTLGKLAIKALADAYGISADKLLARKASIRTTKELEAVIASLMKEPNTKTVKASYAADMFEEIPDDKFMTGFEFYGDDPLTEVEDDFI